jgi:uncharacterized protein YkwD
MSLQFTRWLAAGAGLALLLGGCPQVSNTGQVRIPTNNSTDTAAGGGTTSTLGGTTSDSLSVEFPGCNESLDADRWKTQVLQLVNQERQSRGLSAVRYDATLESQAEQYCCEMIYYDFFDHDNPETGTSLGDRAAEFEYEYWVIGENLAAGQPDPVAVMEDWMNSPGHRENILNPSFTELGVGVRTGGSYGIYWVQEFGRHRDDGPPRRQP